MNAARLRPVAPLLIVTGFAMYGQISYGLTEYSPAEWPTPFRVLVAVGAAVAVESIALYVQWHAHDALLQKATGTAARLRRVSYGLALAVAAVNYWHFADGFAPTPAAVVFALFSAAGPWLWGLHTRRAQHIQLIREGQVDSTGAVFSAERFRNFPLRTIGARRWSIDHNVTDPREAWEGYRIDREKRRLERDDRRVARQAERSARDQAPVEAATPAALVKRPAPQLQVAAPAQIEAKPAKAQTKSRGRTTSLILANPPALAIELAAKHGKDVLRTKAREQGLQISEHEAKELRKRFGPNNNDQVTTS